MLKPEGHSINFEFEASLHISKLNCEQMFFVTYVFIYFDRDDILD